MGWGGLIHPARYLWFSLSLFCLSTLLGWSDPSLLLLMSWQPYSHRDGHCTSLLSSSSLSFPLFPSSPSPSFCERVIDDEKVTWVRHRRRVVRMEEVCSFFCWKTSQSAFESTSCASWKMFSRSLNIIATALLAQFCVFILASVLPGYSVHTAHMSRAALCSCSVGLSFGLNVENTLA